MDAQSSSKATETGGEIEETRADWYCPQCARPVADPLVCGDCLAIICRACGTTLERTDELALG